MKHDKNNGREFNKNGLNVNIGRGFGAESSFEMALRTLKRRMVQEGVIKDLRRKEYYETKGQKARRRKEEAVRRTMKLKKLQVISDI